MFEALLIVSFIRSARVRCLISSMVGFLSISLIIALDSTAFYSRSWISLKPLEIEEKRHMVVYSFEILNIAPELPNINY